MTKTNKIQDSELLDKLNAVGIVASKAGYTMANIAKAGKILSKTGGLTSAEATANLLSNCKVLKDD